MSNLGWYQKITTWSKQVNGPVNLLVLAVASGVALDEGILRPIGKKVLPTVKRCTSNLKATLAGKSSSEAVDTIYEVTTSGKSNEELKFLINDRFRVLETDGDSVLIEKIGDDHNPYYVSANFLGEISDYTI